MSLSQAQLYDLIDSVIKPNDRKVINAQNTNRVLREIVTSCFNTGGANMANEDLPLTADRLHDGSDNSWGIVSLSQLYFQASVSPPAGASMKFQGYGTGVDNQIFQVQNGIGSNAILTTGNLRTTFGGNIAAGAAPLYAKVTGQTAVLGEYGGYFISQFDVGVRGLSETATGVQGESDSGFGVHGVSPGGTGVKAVSSAGLGLYAESYNNVAFQAISSNHTAGYIGGNSPARALEVNNAYVGGGTAVEGNALNGNVGVFGTGGNYGVAGTGINGGIFYPNSTGWGLLAQQSGGAGALKTTGKVIMETLSITPTVANEVYVYDDGTRKYLCIN